MPIDKLNKIAADKEFYDKFKGLERSAEQEYEFEPKLVRGAMRSHIQQMLEQPNISPEQKAHITDYLARLDAKDLHEAPMPGAEMPMQEHGPAEATEEEEYPRLYNPMTKTSTPLSPKPRK